MTAIKSKAFFQVCCGLVLLAMAGVRMEAAAQNVTNNVSASGTAAYIINGQSNPTLTLTRSVTYVFTLTGLSIHPFYIKTNLTTGTGGTWANGVVNNGSTSANVIFTVPTTPLPSALTNTLFYHCSNHATMGGLLNIVDPPGPVSVKIVYITVSNNIVIQSTGTNTWGVTPFCNCDLRTTNWVALPSFTNTFTNGVNVTSFPRPDAICGSNQPAFFRIRQQFP
jgi:hypothetical protein